MTAQRVMSRPAVDRQAAAADALFAAREALQPVPPVRDTFGLDGAEDGYAVQELNTVRHLNAGRRLVGRKVGLTARAVQLQLGVDQPDYGMLWGTLATTPATRFRSTGSCSREWRPRSPSC